MLLQTSITAFQSCFFLGLLLVVDAKLCFLFPFTAITGRRNRVRQDSPSSAARRRHRSRACCSKSQPADRWGRPPRRLPTSRATATRTGTSDTCDTVQSKILKITLPCSLIYQTGSVLRCSALCCAVLCHTLLLFAFSEMQIWTTALKTPCYIYH